MQKLLLRLLANVIFITIAPSVHANINNIKGTYDILKPKYKHLSVIHGAVAWETETIRRMYDLGALGQEMVKNKEGKLARNVQHIKSKTIQLIYSIFYRHPNTTSVADFVVTKSIQAIPNDEVAQFVADTMIYLKTLSENEVIKKYQTTKNKTSVKTALKQNKALLELKPGENFDHYKDPLKNLTPLIFEAYLECVIEEFLPDYTPALILLSLLYQQTNLNRDTIETYYKHLQNNYKDCFVSEMSLQDWQEWKTNIFKTDDLNLIKREFEATPITEETIQEHYEKFAFVMLSPKGYPKDISYSSATITNGSQSASFADCMDTTVRNIINSLSYNPHTKLFSTALLEERLGKTPHQSLKTFYDKNSSPTSAGETPVHSDWAQNVISSIPFVSYNSSLPHKAKSSEFGYIKINTKIPDDLGKFLKEKNYTVLSDEETAYELNPSMKNLIIVLDHLLGLNLFEAEPLEEAFIREDFVEFYLPKLAAALKATLPERFIEKELKDIDKKDYTNTEIQLPLSFLFSDGYTPKIKITTSSGHGQFFSENDTTQKNILSLRTLENSPLSSILLITDSSLLPTAQIIFCWLFSQPIDNVDFASQLFQSIHIFNENIFNLFLFIVGKHADETTKTRYIISLYTTALNNGLTQNKIIEKAIEFAKESVKSNIDLIKNKALNFFKVLVEKDRAFDEAIIAAKENIKDDSFFNQPALDLFKVLFKKNKGLSEAIKFAQEGVKSDNHSEQKAALNLFIYLVKENKALDEASKAAQDSMNSSEENLLEALSFFQALVEKDKAFDEAINIAARGAHSNSDRTITIEALKLFQALVEKEKDFDEAIEAADRNVQFKDNQIKKEVLKLFQALVKKGKAFNEAIEAAASGERSDNNFSSDLFQTLIETAENGMNADDNEIKRNALRLFQALVKKGKAIDEANKAIEKVKQSKNNDLSKDVNKLFIILQKQKEDMESRWNQG